MSRSKQLSLAEIRDVFNLVGECFELGADPVAWRVHLVRCLPRLLNCQVAFGGLADLRSDFDRTAVLRAFSDFGWGTDSERQVYENWITTGQPWEMPVSAKVFSSGVTSVTSNRRNWIDDQTWYNAPLVRDVLQSAQLDDVTFAYEQLEPGRFLLLVGQRNCRDKRFVARDESRLDLLKMEIVRHLGKRLSLFHAASVLELPARLQEVLRALLDGATEKEVGQLLGISPHTVHEHVKRLHKHFQVTSRGELLATCSRFRQVLMAGR